jgi:GT2 family glycosyltransferase
MSKSSRKKYAVDVITPVYGSPGFLRDLSQSLLYDVDAGLDFHWIVLDDATPEDRDRDGVLEVLNEIKGHEDVTVVQNKVNGGFSKANNLAARKGRAPLILMLNSDTLMIEDGWMAKMADNFHTNPLVGVVGARLLFFEGSKDPNRPAGSVQHAGVAFNIHRQPYHIFMAWPSDHSKVMEKRTMRAVTGACLMTRRSLWRKMGGLAEVYTVGNFEDVEYCVQLSAGGYAVVYDPEVCLYHYGSGSDNTETAVKNHSIFQLRNGHLTAWDDWRYW